MNRFLSLFLVSFSIFICANVLSFIILSDGHGMPWLKVNDGIRRMGFPLLFWKEGGFAYRNEFNRGSFMADAAIAFGVSGIVGLGSVRARRSQ